MRTFVGDATWDDYLKFSFVRDPFDRLRSLYFYFERMLARRREPHLRNALLWLPGTGFRDPLKWPGMQALLETESFSGFIRHPAFSTEIGARPQSVAARLQMPGSSESCAWRMAWRSFLPSFFMSRTTFWPCTAATASSGIVYSPEFST